MTWFKVDDKLAFHPKALRAGNAAMGAWARIGAWCASLENDGRVPLVVLNQIANDDEIRALVSAGFLDVVSESEYQMHDFLAFNPSRKELNQKRKRWKTKKRRQRRVSPGDSPVESTGESGSGRDGTVDLNSVSESEPDQPVRLDLDSESTGVHKLAHPANCNRGTRLSDEWNPPSEETPHSWHQIAREKGFTKEHVSDILASFKAHWARQRGAKGQHVDWDRTWRNWLRRESPYRTAVPNQRTLQVAKQQPAPAGEYDWYQAKLARDAEAAKKAGGG